MKSGFGTLGVVDRDEDTVGCHECGRRFRMLVQHLRLAHEMTVAEYRRLHQLPATVPLTCLSTSELISAQSTARVGSPKWVRFERARDRTLPASQVAASHASQHKALGGRMLSAEAGRRRRGEQRLAARNDDLWASHLDAFIEAWQHTGKPPSTADDDHARQQLGQWLKHQRRLHARGELDPGRARRIQDAGIPLTVPRGSHWWKRG